MPPRKKLGELLMEAGLIDQSGLEVGLAAQRASERPLGVTLVLLDLCDEAKMLRVLGRQLELPVAKLAGRVVDPELAELLPYEFAKTHQCIPLCTDGEDGKTELYIGMANPTNLAVLDDIRFRTGMVVHPVLVSPLQIDDAIERNYSKGGFDPSAEQPQTERDLDLDAADTFQDPDTSTASEVLPDTGDSSWATQMQADPPAEAREHPRTPLRKLPTVLRCPSPATGIDISMGGIRFACEGLQVSEGETLPLELRLDGQSFLVIGTVIRVASFSNFQQEVALAFKDLDPDCQRRLAELLART